MYTADRRDVQLSNKRKNLAGGLESGCTMMQV